MEPISFQRHDPEDPGSSESDTFTPVPDMILRELGRTAALVYGRVWRFAQLATGVCSASTGRIAAELGVSRTLVFHHLKCLCASGYLIDRTPHLKSKPHSYAITAKTRAPRRNALRPPFPPREGGDPSASPGGGRPSDPGLGVSRLAERVSPLNDGVSGVNDGVSPLNDGVSPLNASVQPTDTKKEVKKESKKQEKRGNDAARRAHQVPAVALFHSVTGRYPPRVNFEDIEAVITRIATRLGRDPSREDLLPFYRAWTARGYNTGNLAWLQWAEAGEVAGKAKASKHNAAGAIERWANGH